MGIDPVAHGLVEHHETIDVIGDVKCWVRDLHMRGRRRTTAAARGRRDAAAIVLEFDIAAPRQTVWEYLRHPDSGRNGGRADEVREITEGGRRGVGTTNHCMHGTARHHRGDPRLAAVRLPDADYARARPRGSEDHHDLRVLGPPVAAPMSRFASPSPSRRTRRSSSRSARSSRRHHQRSGGPAGNDRRARRARGGYRRTRFTRIRRALPYAARPGAPTSRWRALGSGPSRSSPERLELRLEAARGHRVAAVTAVDKVHVVSVVGEHDAGQQCFA